MEHPIFSLATKPDMRFLHYQDSKGNTLEVEPSGKGLPTIFDKDVLIFCISQLMHLKMRLMSPVRSFLFAFAALCAVGLTEAEAKSVRIDFSATVFANNCGELPAGNCFLYYDALQVGTTYSAHLFIRDFAGGNIFLNGEDEVLSRFTCEIAGIVCYGLTRTGPSVFISVDLVSQSFSILIGEAGLNFAEEIRNFGIFGWNAQDDQGFVFNNFSADVSNSSINIVPLPAAMPLLIVGLGSLALMARRRRSFLT